MASERTFIAVKPDGVQRGLVGHVVAKYEKKGYKLVGLKILVPTMAQAQEHYVEHKGKHFFDELCTYFSSGPICAMCFEGLNVIRGGCAVKGRADPNLSAPGTLRRDLSIQWNRNVVHSADGPESAAREIALWFRPEELASYSHHSAAWVNE